MEGIIVVFAFVENNLLDKEFALLKNASKYFQFLDRTARDFREMLATQPNPRLALFDSLGVSENHEVFTTWLWLSDADSDDVVVIL